jgi:hypothetical protein
MLHAPHEPHARVQKNSAACACVNTRLKHRRIRVPLRMCRMFFSVATLQLLRTMRLFVLPYARLRSFLLL